MTGSSSWAGKERICMKDILLVEDNRELAELLQAFLEKDGFTVHPVPTGEEAAAYL